MRSVAARTALAFALALPGCATDDTAVDLDGAAPGADATTPGDASPPSADTGVDATQDVAPGVDAQGGDSNADAEADSSADAEDTGADAPADAVVDAPVDAPADSSTKADAGHDAASDAPHDGNADAKG